MLISHFKVSFLDLKLADPLALDWTGGISFLPDNFALYFSFCAKIIGELVIPIRIKETTATPSITIDTFLMRTRNIVSYKRLPVDFSFYSNRLVPSQSTV